MSRLRLSELKAPIAYAEIRRGYQLVRAGAALLIGGLGVLGLVWQAAEWVFYVVPAVLALAHALYRLQRPGSKPLTSLLVDISVLGTVLLVVGGSPQAETAVVAYLITASLLLLSLVEAALVLAYASLWGALITQIAPLSDLGPVDGPRGDTLGRIAGIGFLILIAVLLLSASKVIHLFQKKQREALERERQANRLKNEFVSMVSHEFRTPLTSIAGFIETLRDRREYLSEEDIDEFLEIMHGEALHLSNLVEDVLVIPRLEAGRLHLVIEDFDLQPLVERVMIRLVPHSSAMDTDVSIPGGVIVRADPNRLVQVVRNLLENAVKYGGDQILVEGAVVGDSYEVAICDNGPGVPDEDVRRIFDHFEQLAKGDARTAQGIGLGLPIAQRLLRAMGGDLWYESRFPTGARFCFSLPLVGLSETVRSEPAAASL